MYLSGLIHGGKESLFLELDVVGDPEPGSAFQDLLRFQKPRSDRRQPATHQRIQRISGLTTQPPTISEWITSCVYRYRSRSQLPGRAWSGSRRRLWIRRECTSCRRGGGTRRSRWCRRRRRPRRWRSWRGGREPAVLRWLCWRSSRASSNSPCTLSPPLPLILTASRSAAASGTGFWSRFAETTTEWLSWRPPWRNSGRKKEKRKVRVRLWCMYLCNSGLSFMYVILLRKHAFLCYGYNRS